MHTFQRNQNRRSGSGTRLSMRKGGLVKIALLIALLISFGTWFGLEVRASGGQGSAVWQKLVNTLTLRQSPDQGGRSGRTTERTEPATRKNDPGHDGHVAEMINLTNKMGGLNATAAGGGPVVLDGMDPVCHAGMGEATDGYIRQVVKSVYDLSNGRPNNNQIAILGISNISLAGGCGGNWNTLLSTKFLSGFGTAASGLQPTVTFYTTSAELNTFFSSVINSSNPPRMVWIPDDWSRSVDGTFTSNAEKIADFVNGGGGLFTSLNGYGWLSALLPGATFNSGGCNGGPAAAPDGVADFGLNDSIVTACWHGYFTGNLGTLKTLVQWPYNGATQKVSIGGGSVTLPSSFTLTPSTGTPLAGSPITMTVTAVSLTGTAYAGVTVTLTVASGPGAGQTYTATTNSSGIATFSISNNTPGTATYTATATINSSAKSISSTVVWGNPPFSQVVIATQPVAGVSGAALTTQPVIELRDPLGNLSTSNSAVTATIQSGTGGTLGGTTTVNAVNGVATFTNLSLAGIVGTNYVIRFTAGSFTADSNNVTPSGPGAATQLVLTTAPVSGASGAVFATQPALAIRDSAGNNVTSWPNAVTVAIQTGAGGTLGGTTSVTPVNGVATFSGLSLGGLVGTNYVLRFSSGPPAIALTVDTGNMTVTPGTATQLVLTTAPVASASGAALATQPVVAIKDAQGNTVTTATGAVTVAIQSGTGGTLGGTKTVNAVAGVATFSGLTLTGTVGTNYVLRFTSPGLTQIDSGNLSVTPGGATTLALTTAPVTGASGAVLPTQPVVTIRDDQGNTAAASTAAVTVAIQSGTGGTLGGTTTVNAVAGVATFSGLSLTGKVGTTYVLRFTSSGLTSVDSGNLTVTVGAASQLALTTQPVGGATGAPLTTQPVVAIRDSAGNPVTTSTAAVTVAIQSGTGGTLGGTTTVNAVAGVATFSGVTMSGTLGTSYVLRFSSTGLTPADSAAVTVRVLNVQSIARVGSNPSSSLTISWTVTISEAVTGVTAANFALTGSRGAEITSVTGSGTTWTVTANVGTAGGSLGLSMINSTGVANSAGLGLTNVPFSTGETFSLAPRITGIDQMSTNPVVVSSSSSPTNTAEVDFMIHFSETVTGLTTSNFMMMGSSASASSILTVTGSGKDWTIRVRVGGTGTVALMMMSSTGVQDSDGNPVGNMSVMSNYYQVAPRILSMTRVTASPTSLGRVNYTVTFSESVTGLTPANFALVTTGGSGAAVSAVTGSGTTWTVTVDLGATAGSVALRLANSTGVRDSDTVAVAASTLPFTGDVYVVAPRVVSLKRLGSPTTAESFADFEVTFNEPVVGLTTANMAIAGTVTTLTGTGTVTYGALTGSGTVWRIRLNLPEGAGSVGVNMANSTGVRDTDNLTVGNLIYTGETVSVIAVRTTSTVSTGTSGSRRRSGISGTDGRLSRTFSQAADGGQRIGNGDLMLMTHTVTNMTPGPPMTMWHTAMLPIGLRAIPWTCYAIDDLTGEELGTCTISSPRSDQPVLTTPRAAAGDGSLQRVGATATGPTQGEPMPEQEVVWTGDVAPGQQVYLEYEIQIANEVLTQTSHSVYSYISNTYKGPPVREKMSGQVVASYVPVGPGELVPDAGLASGALAGQKQGSVLIYPLYTSTVNTARQDSRFSITNTSPDRTGYVHLFFVDGADCSVADQFITLTQNQTVSFNASDLDPLVTGYLVAVAVDENGCPRFFNHLIGSVLVKFESGHGANLSAVGVAALAGGLRPCAANDVTTDLVFDGISYNEIPRTLAMSNIPARADGNQTMLVLTRVGGNLAGVGGATLGPLFGLLYDDQERSASYTMAGGTCQVRTMLTGSSLRTAPRFESMVPGGRTGWLKISTGNDEGMLGVMLNQNPNGFSQGHVLHTLSLSRAAVLTIPVAPPNL